MIDCFSSTSFYQVWYMIYDIYVDPKKIVIPSKTKESIDHPKDLRSKLILEASQQPV